MFIVMYERRFHFSIRFFLFFVYLNPLPWMSRYSGDTFEYGVIAINAQIWSYLKWQITVRKCAVPCDHHFCTPPSFIVSCPSLFHCMCSRPPSILSVKGSLYALLGKVTLLSFADMLNFIEHDLQAKLSTHFPSTVRHFKNVHVFQTASVKCTHIWSN